MTNNAKLPSVGKFLNKLGFHQTTISQYKKISAIEAKKRKLEVWSPFDTKQKRIISRDTLAGTGLGFSIGGLIGGLPGMMVGATAGTYAGNLYGRREAGRPTQLSKLPKVRREIKFLSLQEKK